MRLHIWILLLGLGYGCNTFAPLPGGNSPYRYATTPPAITLNPPNPCEGDAVIVQGANGPPDGTLEIWLVPQIAGGFKMGLPHPDGRGVKLGEAQTDAGGKFTFQFEMHNPFADRQMLPKGHYGLWLVYPDGITMAPYAAFWECPPPTTFRGRLFDEEGRLVTEPAEVRITAYTHAEDVLFEKTVEAVDGSYEVTRVPAPALTEFAVTRKGWPTRIRRERDQISAQWGEPRDNASTEEFLKRFGEPVTFNFGGPASPEDPHAPAFFLSSRLDEASFRTTTLSGAVYDKEGQKVPDSAGAKVIVETMLYRFEHPQHVRKTVEVRDGAYTLPEVPTGTHLSLEIRTNFVYPLNGFTPRWTVLIPPSLSGHPAVVNFGGPATPEDPEAPAHPFPYPAPPNLAPSPLVPAP